MEEGEATVTKESDIESEGMLLIHFQVRDSGRMDHDGEGGTAMYGGERLRQKGKCWHGE